MLSFRRLIVQEPLSVLAALWPLALLAPLVPGLPKPSINGLPWRQEIVLGLLLCAALTLLARRAFKTGARSSTLRRSELFALLPLILFFLWSAASLLWATSAFPVLHHTFEWGAYLLFFFLMTRAARHPRTLRASIITLAVVVCVISISCIVEFWGSDALIIRPAIGLGEPFAVALPIFTVLALKLRRSRVAALCGITAVLTWLVILLSLERAPATGASVALLVLVAASFFRRQWRPRSLKRALILLLFFGAAVALQALPSSDVQQRPSAFARLQTAASASDLNTQVRFLVWGAGLEMWRDRPLTGVGADNFDTAFPEARAQFSAKHPNSALIPLSEDRLIERAHNEYIQILAELGAVGFTLFIIFCVALIVAAWRVLRYAKSPLALGGVCSLVAFALSSGASSVSFRWMGSGLIFFFAAALVLHFSVKRPQADKALKLSPLFVRTATATALALSLLIFCGRGAQATNSILQGMAETASSKHRAEQLYSQALAWNPYDAPTHLNFGMWLYLNRRPGEAVPYLRYATAHGFNSSVCYAYLAAAEAGAGDLAAAERTMAVAVRVYPRSVFLRVRHATALAEVGQWEAAAEEYDAALAFDSRLARAWRQLICFGRNAAKTAAFYDKGIAMSGELSPENCIFAVLDENERRTPVAVLEESSTLNASANQIQK